MEEDTHTLLLFAASRAPRLTTPCLNDSVSTMEAASYPFYGVQWHPEKNIFELGKYPDGMPYEAIPHTVEAIDTTQFMAKSLVLEARKNDHAYPDQATESAALIWNYPVYVTGMEFVQEYIDDFP